jgi:Holliday junction resolvase YEN1
MAGGDYSPGLANCGPSIALGLTKSGFGDALLNAVETLRDNALNSFLSTWRQEIRHELIHNSKGFLTSRQPQLAAQIPDSFPNRDILDLYVYPLTSWSSPTENPPNPVLWKSREPRIFDITKFCSRNLGWKTDQDIAHHFQNTLWKGVFFRMISSVSNPDTIHTT